MEHCIMKAEIEEKNSLKSISKNNRIRCKGARSFTATFTGRAKEYTLDTYTHSGGVV